MKVFSNLREGDIFWCPEGGGMEAIFFKYSSLDRLVQAGYDPIYLFGGDPTLDLLANPSTEEFYEEYPRGRPENDSLWILAGREEDGNFIFEGNPPSTIEQIEEDFQYQQWTYRGNIYASN